MMTLLDCSYPNKSVDMLVQLISDVLGPVDRIAHKAPRAEFEGEGYI